MKSIIILLLLLLCNSIFSQNRIPKDGENIIFYPLNKECNITKKGYDCFYSYSEVTAKGKYNFKPKFRFKKDDLNMTSANEIEGYTFHVEKQEIISENGKEFLLLFLKRNEDEERLILRVPKFFDKKSNEITQCLVLI